MRGTRCARLGSRPARIPKAPARSGPTCGATWVERTLTTTTGGARAPCRRTPTIPMSSTTPAGRAEAKEHPMNVKIAFPQPPSVAAELPLYATVQPAWNVDQVAALGTRLDVRGEVVDAGNWFVVRDGVSTLEVYQASHS